MSDTRDFETLLENHPAIEAVIRISRDGLPLASHTRADAPHIDEIVSVIAGLYAAARDSRLLKEDDGGRLFIGAVHGSLYCRAIDEQTLLLLLTTDQSTEQQLERMYEEWKLYSIQ